jgi:cytochrome d ubiquinol oxidase subunit I
VIDLVAHLASTLIAAALAPAEQQHLLEARQMQALSFAVHIPLVCFGIAFPSMVLLVESLYVRTGNEVYRTLAKRWSKVMIALFAVGVVTGTILSFEMGLLWPNFMATFGDVFGLAFGLEGFSFFIEAIFIAIYVYGWDRMSSRMHLLAGIPVVIAGLTGSLFVISVNAWMNRPTGFRLEHGRAVDVDPWGALFGNRHLWPELTHMYFAGFIVTGFLVASVYAWGWLRGRRGRYERVALAVPLTIAALAAPVQLLIGDWIARRVTEDQPIKLAALEGLGPTTKGAPFHFLGWYEDGKVKYGIEIPKLLSILAKHDPNATIEGLEAVPADDRPPPINLIRFAFQTMVGIGSLLAALGVAHLLTWFRRRRFVESRWFLWGVVAAGPLSLVALVAGWVTTEVGRQPWVVYHVMRTSEAVTGAGGIPVGYATLVVVYVGLGVGVAWILRRLASRPLDVPDEPPPILEAHAPR